MFGSRKRSNSGLKAESDVFRGSSRGTLYGMREPYVAERTGHDNSVDFMVHRIYAPILMYPYMNVYTGEMGTYYVLL